MKRVLLPLATSVLFSGSYVGGKYTTLDLGPLTTTALRYSIALAFLASLLVHYRTHHLRVAFRDVPALVGLGLTGIVGYHYFFFASLRYTQVAKHRDHQCVGASGDRHSRRHLHRRTPGPTWLCGCLPRSPRSAGAAHRRRPRPSAARRVRSRRSADAGRGGVLDRLHAADQATLGSIFGLYPDLLRHPVRRRRVAPSSCRWRAPWIRSALSLAHRPCRWSTWGSARPASDTCSTT